MNNLFQNTTIYKVKDLNGTPVFQKDLRPLSCMFLVKCESDFPPELKEMFEKIIAALGLSINQADVILCKKPTHAAMMQAQWKAERVIVMGLSSEEISIQADLQLYKVYKLPNFQCLMVNDAVDIYGNQGLKTKFWGHLKSMFE